MSAYVQVFYRSRRGAGVVEATSPDQLPAVLARLCRARIPATARVGETVVGEVSDYSGDWTWMADPAEDISALERAGGAA